MKRVACYVRVSTENQLENYSIDEQTERLNNYCKAMNWDIYKVYTDGGFSGGNLTRPALQQLLKDIQSRDRLIDAVVVYKLDRLSRSQKDTLTLIEDYFLKNSVDFISVCESFDTSTPFGKAMIGILSVFAQLEKDQITERFTMGRIGRSKAGYFHGGGNAPKGYDYIDSKLVINEYEAMQIREIFKMFLNGKTINGIQVAMKDKYGSLWNNSQQISNVIKNPLYIGKVRFKGVEYDGIHTPIIDTQTFTMANDMLTSSDREQTKNVAQKSPFRAGYLLSSKVWCSQCGARYSANHGYYKCYSRSKASKKFITNPDCKNANWKIDELDDIVISQIENLSLYQNLDRVFEQLPQTSNTDTQNIDVLQARIKDIENQTSKLIELFQISEIPLQDVRDRIISLNSEKAKLQSMVESSKANDIELRKQKFLNALERFQSAFNSSDLDQRRLMISSIISTVNIDEQIVQVEWNI